MNSRVQQVAVELMFHPSASEVTVLPASVKNTLRCRPCVQQWNCSMELGEEGKEKRILEHQ
jgi:hypothetical protein